MQQCSVVGSYNDAGGVQAFGALWEPAVLRLLKPMILTGLSDSLTRALQRVARKLPATVPVIRQHLLLPVLAALPVTVEQPESGMNGANGAHMPSAHAVMGQSVARHRDGATVARAHAIARVCFNVKGSLLKPALADFAKQVHAQVRPRNPVVA